MGPVNRYTNTILLQGAIDVGFSQNPFFASVTLALSLAPHVATCKCRSKDLHKGGNIGLLDQNVIGSFSSHSARLTLSLQTPCRKQKNWLPVAQVVHRYWCTNWMISVLATHICHKKHNVSRHSPTLPLPWTTVMR